MHGAARLAPGAVDAERARRAEHAARGAWERLHGAGSTWGAHRAVGRGCEGRGGREVKQ